MQVHASGWPNDMQVQKLHRLASPFGQGLMWHTALFLSPQKDGSLLSNKVVFLTGFNALVLKTKQIGT